ncbi:unknown_gene_6220 [Phodopus roborovskii]|uniref:Unknown_gene_6220 protein n=1 Tax=Phodopus roborovskii TaxID=109678 RepID=A0AAU9Z939_PHORO|nr:unknown_gene_6220 [Phodopus roborovskii]
MKGYQGQGCVGRRGRATGASQGRWGMHVLGHRGVGRTEGAGCKVENAHREGAQNRRFAKCQGQTGRGGGRRLAEDQEQKEETTSPSKGRFG